MIGSPRLGIRRVRTLLVTSLAAGIRPIDIAELMGYRDVKTTLTVYAHLINTDDHTGNMAALGALSAPVQAPSYGKVIPLHGAKLPCG
nr:hypothetical protein [Mycobacterium sp.]